MDEPRPQRILWLSHGYGYNGELMYFEGIFTEFARGFPSTRIAVEQGFPTARYPNLPLWPILKFRRLRHQRMHNGALYVSEFKFPALKAFFPIHRFDPDLVIAIEFTPIAMLGFLFAKLCRKRYLLLVESDPTSRGAPNNWFSRLIKGFIARGSDLVMTNNPLGHRFVAQQLKVPEHKIIEAPYLTSDPNIHRSEATASSGEAAFAASRVKDKINALYINSVEDRKGLATLVSAFGRLSPRLQRAYIFHIVGDGSRLNEIKSRVESMGASDCFLFYGRVPYMQSWRFYEIADLFISPTLADYRSLTGFEAVNCGKPLLLSVLDGAHHEVVQEGVNGWTFDPRDTVQFSTLLEMIATRPERLGEFGANSKLLSERFSMIQIGKNLQVAATLVLRRT